MFYDNISRAAFWFIFLHTYVTIEKNFGDTYEEKNILVGFNNPLVHNDIFYQSNEVAVQSSEKSMVLVVKINSYIESVFDTDKNFITETLVRKCAHFFEYFILGILLFKGFQDLNNLKKTAFISVGLGVVYAMSDEFHQYFIPGRAMRLFDIIIDSAGIIFATIILYRYKKNKTAD